MLRHALPLLLTLALGLAPSLASAEVFRWVDELGVTHYTSDRDTIPRRFRDDAKTIEPTPTPRTARRVRRASSAVTPPLPLPSAAIPAALPATETALRRPTPVFPGPIATPSLRPGDPRGTEVAELEARIAADRERLREIISTKRWDSTELASDPSIREIAERLPRLQSELAALRAETVP